MKIIKTILVFLFIIICRCSVAQNLNLTIPQRDYWGNTHSHILDEANKFLFWRKGFSYLEICNNLEAIRAGDYDEDELDLVYGYDDIGGYGVTSTHFWVGDYGDEQTNNFLTIFRKRPNAYMKARKFIHGDYWAHYTDENDISHCFQYPDSQFELGLINYYKSGQVYCIAKNPDGSEHGWEMHSQNVRTTLTFKILGHIIHLLQDMSVPVHNRAEIHTSDDYEVYAGGVSLIGTNYRAAGEFYDPFIAYGGDPIRGLFYTSNQIADLFPCEGTKYLGLPYSLDGNMNFPQGTNDVLNAYVTRIFPDPNSYFQVYESYVQANILTHYSVNAVASLLYWFGVRADCEELNAPNVIRYSSNMIGNPIVGYQLYKKQTGILTPVTSGQVSSFGWHLYECDSPDQIMFPFNQQNVYSVSNWNDPFLSFYNQQFLGNSCYYSNNGSLPNAMYIQSRLAVNNYWGYTYWTGRMSIKPDVNEMPVGCPFMFILGIDTTSGKYYIENNLLHRSEFDEYYNQNVTDLYKLKTTPRIDSNIISIQLIETSNSINSFDQVKLLAIDHPYGSNVGITESNDIVIYYPGDVSSTDDAIKNNKSNNITNLIQYGQTSPKVTGIINDNIYAHFDSLSQLNKLYLFKKRLTANGKTLIDSLAIIGELGSNTDIYDPTPAKDWAGNIIVYTSSDTYSRNFAKRVLVSDVIIPFAQTNENVDHIDINYTSDYAMNYFAVTPISYYGFTETEMPLIEATHGLEENILNKLQYIDNDYVVLDSTSIIDLSFQFIEQSNQNMLRDYVIFVNGKYISGNRVQQSKPLNTIENKSVKPSNIHYTYKLNLNYPNPFNPTTKIIYELEKPGFTKLSIFDILGRIVDIPINEYKKEGNYTFEYNASRLSSGVYFYRLESSNFVDTKRMILIK